MKFKTDKNHTCTEQSQWFESYSGPCHNMCWSEVTAQKSQRAQWTVFQIKYTSQRLSKPHRLELWESCTYGDCLPPNTNHSMKVWKLSPFCKESTTQLMHICQSSQTLHNHTWSHSCYLPLIPEWPEKLRWKMPSPACPTDVRAEQSSTGGTILQETLSCMFFWVSA